MIRFESVTKQYADGTVAVDELSLQAPSGEITVFVGPSGCGKTTSLRMINRMIDPTGGRILLDDRDVATVKPPQLRRGIGYVIQHAGLLPHRTVVDNVATVPFLQGTNKATARSRALELLERVGLDPAFAKRYPAQLSGGQQQRVGVARALAADPPVMLMDEPFSAVDPVVREQLQNEFLRLQHELGKTIVFVTHDIDEAIKLGDHVAVMRVGGKLAQFAPPAELLSRPADAFVAGFVGRDRGYRALGFTESGQLPLVSESVVELGDTLREARERESDGWVLVLDGERRPLGWLAIGGVAESALVGEVTRELLNLGGTLATESGTLREALDAALSAPQRTRCGGARGRHLRRNGHRHGGAGPHREPGLGRPGAEPARRRARCAGAARRRDCRGRFVNAIWHFYQDNRSSINSWTLSTLWLAALPVVVGLAIALPLGWLAYRFRWTYPPLVTGAGIIYTIPAIVMFLLIPGLIGTKILATSNVAVALTLYTVALLVRVVADGLSSVSADTLAAASAVGYTARQRLFGVQLPIAVPVIGAGVRVAAVSNVSLVSVASIIGTPQLGQLFIDGLNNNTLTPVILGGVMFIVIALVYDALVVFAVRLATPWQRAVRAR